MNDAWTQHLQQAGAILTDRGARFADTHEEARAAIAGDVVAALSDYAFIEASGPDAAAFLQAQLSNDVRALDAEQSQLSGYCNPKGRLLAAFRLLRIGDRYLLRLPAEILEPTLKRLRMFVLRSQVQLEDVSAQTAAIGVAGPAAEARLRETAGTLPAQVDGAVHAAGAVLVRVAGAIPRFELYGPTEAIAPLWDALATAATPVGPAAWALLDIHAGLPTVRASTMEAFVPQMVNLEVIGGVSFKKGCYPGQEVVARMHYLGKPKRRMFLAHLAEAAPPPRAGDELFRAGESQSSGRIVDAQPAAEGGSDLLAVIQLGSLGGEPLHLRDSQGPALQLRELPYALERS